MTISTRKRFRFLAAACALCVAGLLMQGVVYGADAVAIPSDWWTAVADGPYKCDFSGGVPDWGNTVGLGVIDDTGKNSHDSVNTAYDSRPNQWFGAKGASGGNSLRLNTGEGVFQTPTITGSSSFSAKPVFIDMRVKFVALSTAPSLGTAKLGVYVLAGNENKNKLQLLDAESPTPYACSTSVSDLTADWHHLTVRMNSAYTYQVFLDDTSISSGRSLNNATDQKLNSIAFKGTGWIDELYLSNGDPKGPFPSGLSTAFGEADSATKDWVLGKMNAGNVNATDVFNSYNTGTKLNNAYLLDTLSSTYNTPVFGIKSFELTSPTTLNVVVYLTVGTTPKTGSINGRIRVLSKATKGGEYEERATTTITSAAFAGGTSTATYTFTVPAGDLFFKPIIVE